MRFSRNWRGLSAYAAGFIAMLPFMSTDFYRGPMARSLHGADLSMPVGLLVAGGLYMLSYRFADLGNELRAATHADVGLDLECET